MLNSFFAGLKAENNNEQFSTRRRFSRRSCDHSIAIIGDQHFSVDNWSMGGIALNGDTRAFGVNTSVDMTLKFKLRDHVIKLVQTARVVRKNAHRVAFEFEPLSRDNRRGLQSVVDDHVASRFAKSQLLN